MKYKKKEEGLVSIISVIIIVIIITIITLSLAALTRRSLRQSLDEQLSAQAQYAAESGINDAIRQLQEDKITTDITDCSAIGNTTEYSFTPVLSTDSNVRYTCVLVDQVPSSIVTDLTKEEVKVYPLVNSGANPISTLTIKWKARTGVDAIFPSCTASSSCLLSSSEWGNRIALLRVRLIPYPASGLDASSIASGLIDVTAYPFDVDTIISSTADVASEKNHVIEGDCSNSDKTCTINISGMTSPGRYYLQLYSYYNDATVTVTGQDSSNSGVRFSGAQITIDSTGVSQDVAKRIKVNVPYDGKSELPSFALGVADKLCKRFTTNNVSTIEQGASYNCSAF